MWGVSTYTGTAPEKLSGAGEKMAAVLLARELCHAGSRDEVFRGDKDIRDLALVAVTFHLLLESLLSFV